MLDEAKDQDRNEKYIWSLPITNEFLAFAVETQRLVYGIMYFKTSQVFLHPPHELGDTEW